MQTSQRTGDTHKQGGMIILVFVGSKLTARSVSQGTADPRWTRVWPRPRRCTHRSRGGESRLPQQAGPGPPRLLAGGLRLHSAPRRPPAPLTDSIASTRQFLSLESSLAVGPAPHPVPRATSANVTPQAQGGRRGTHPSGRWLSPAWITFLAQFSGTLRSG